MKTYKREFNWSYLHISCDKDHHNQTLLLNYLSHHWNMILYHNYRLMKLEDHQKIKEISKFDKWQLIMLFTACFTHLAHKDLLFHTLQNHGDGTRCTIHLRHIYRWALILHFLHTRFLCFALQRLNGLYG